jgi:hypothetical protein
MRKGQVEVAVIVGLVVVAVAAIYLGYQALTVPTAPVAPAAIAEEQRLVYDYVNSVVREGAENALADVESRGGFLFPTRALAFLNSPVAYWYQCDTTMYPSLDFIAENIEEGIKGHLRNSLDPSMTIGGKAVEFDNRVAIAVTILDNRMDVLVDLPTKVLNYSMERPYTATVPTRIKRIYDFARDFSEEAANTRFLETLTSSSVMISTDLPFVGFLLECGETLHISEEEISAGVRGAITRTIMPIKWWQKQPPGAGTYAIESVNGNRYEDLDIRMLLPDDFSIDIKNPVFLVNDEILISSSAFVISECIKPYILTYTFNYAPVIRVYDDLSGNYFNFAGLVYVDGLEPGNCGVMDELIPECDDLPCEANITVADSGGSPIRGAVVDFGGCEIGSTGFDGNVAGPSLCGTHELRITSPGHDVLREDVPSDDISGTYVLHGIPSLDIEFYALSGGCAEAPVTNEQVILSIRGEKSYSITNINHSFDFRGCIGEAGEVACEYCGNTSADDTGNCNICSNITNNCQKQALISEAEVSHIPSGSYEMDVLVTSPGAKDEYAAYTDKGFLVLPLRFQNRTLIVPDKESAVLKVYVPDTGSFYSGALSNHLASYNSNLGDCIGMGAGGVCLEECDHNCSKGMAIVDTIDYISIYTSAGGTFDSLLGCVTGSMVKEA